MHVGVVVVSHGASGYSMLEAVEKMVGPLDTRIVTVAIGESREVTTQHVQDACVGLERDETLFLIDLEGSTPFNVCCGTSKKCVILSGVNMPMLLKLATANRDQGAQQLAEELKATGQKSIHIRTGGDIGGRES